MLCLKPILPGCLLWQSRYDYIEKDIESITSFLLTTVSKDILRTTLENRETPRNSMYQTIEYGSLRHMDTTLKSD